ncbi:MAG: sigma-70 family RNA polymerase sigma factor [Verrucomicrobiales bacterium]|nr:sigma-70 family RNA polymerase sigma factor [Verrucomicrobiales bacterium]
MNPRSPAPEDPPPPRHVACTTGWSLILRAQGNTDQAIRELGILVEHYRGFIRKRIGSRLRDFDAEDAEAALVHVEFPKLVRKAFPDGRKGRFRSLLNRAVDNYVISVLRRNTVAMPQQPGESRSFQRRETPIDLLEEVQESSHDPEVDERLDTEFALFIGDQVLADMEAARPPSDERVPMDWLIFRAIDPETGKPISDQELAQRLGVTPGALRVRRVRARAEFRALYGQRVSETVEADDLVDETRYLLGLVCQAKSCEPFHK